MYRDKYLKYKLKYVKIKQIGGNENIVKRILSRFLYNTCPQNIEYKCITYSISVIQKLNKISIKHNTDIYNIYIDENNLTIYANGEVSTNIELENLLFNILQSYVTKKNNELINQIYLRSKIGTVTNKQ